MENTVNFKPLLEKLNPKVLELLERDENQYPNLVSKIYEELKANYIVTLISVHVASTLVGYWGEVNGYNTNKNFILDLYDMFCEDENISF